MSDAYSSHGTLVAYEQDPSGSQGTFTTVAELADVTPPPLQRPSTEVTPHNENIDSYVIGVRRRGEMNMMLNYITTEATHEEASTGLVWLWINGTKTGFRLTYTDGGIWIFSGYVLNVAPETPAREGGTTGAVVIRPSGSMLIEAEALT